MNRECAVPKQTGWASMPKWKQNMRTTMADSESDDDRRSTENLVCLRQELLAVHAPPSNLRAGRRGRARAICHGRAAVGAVAHTMPEDAARGPATAFELMSL